ncbi:hypothetical protein HK102_008016 [Quaeritorhiza haematococci]|nr:hypothetical protein HK102_008016 [Quaeritorhiza haematococci]
MEWLNKYTFPTESLMSSLPHAHKTYTRLITRLLRNGTTTACYYATIHLPATKLLADLCEQMGQRALVGKVCMDQNGGEGYVETTEGALRDMEDFIVYVKGKGKGEGKGKEGLVMPVVTPRFIPTCSVELLEGLGALATKYDSHIQTHALESLDEIAFVQSLHAPHFHSGNDIKILDACKLLSSKCILAHMVHMKSGDAQIVKERGAGISHCALSNAFFAGCVAPVRRWVGYGLKVGLGTDIAGGYAPSMLSSARQAVVTSKTVSMIRASDPSSPLIDFPTSTNDEDESDEDGDDLDYADAFYLATMGGAEVLGLKNQIGSFEVGKAFDAVLVDVWGDGDKSNIERWGSSGSSGEGGDGEEEVDSVEDLFQKFMNLGDDRNVVRVWVQGREVWPLPSSTRTT